MFTKNPDLPRWRVALESPYRPWYDPLYAKHYHIFWGRWDCGVTCLTKIFPTHKKPADSYMLDVADSTP